MSEPVRSLDRITIPKPCNAVWDSMIGNDQVRFCEHCNLHVTDLAAMTRHQAMRFVARSQGRICVRFIQRPNGDVLTKGVPESLYRISRRVSRIAAGAFTATLSLSSAAAQTDSSRGPHRLRQTSAVAEVNSAQELGATLSGVVTDPNGAVVSGAILTLANAKTHMAFTYTTSNEGTYKFSSLEEGNYNLTVEAPGFAKTEMNELELKADNQTVNVTMELPELITEVEVNAPTTRLVHATMGVVVFAEPEEPLVKAAHQNDLDGVKQTLFATPDVNLADKFTNQTALAYAVENSNREMVQVLIAAGADVNARNHNGQTAVMHLTQKASVDLVRDLLYAGADFNARDNSGDTPLLHAASSSSLLVIRELIANGASMDAKNGEGVTVLMKAAENNDPGIVTLLLKAGVDVNANSSNNETALLFASRSGKPATIRALIDARAEVDAKDNEGKTALILAASHDDPQLAKALIDGGAEVNAASDYGTTALMSAASDGQPATVKLLIDAGANINAKDKAGQTALMLANDIDQVRVLLNAGADLTIRDNDGETALSLARKADQTDVVKLLLARGARE